ncbi:MAG TPA: hypothetical protein VJR94_12805 [Candidatus Nitrosocosmicus sp.]|nr:hypothetical protein [Candidatus Nitrosocosmicus sp.]
MEDDLFKRFHDQKLGVSFFYNSLLTSNKDQPNAGHENDLQLKYEDLKFRIIKLSSEANVGLQLFGLENGLRSSLNENETITEDDRLRHNQVDGNETAYTTTIYPTPVGNFKIRRYLVSHDGQGYLIAFQDRVEKFESDESQKIIETILDTFKFLDT